MQKIEVFWRDIPAQILVKSGRVRGKALLSHRFQAAIDRAAMRAGKGGSDEYLEDWRRITSSIEGEGSPQELAEQFAEAIEAAYSDLDIKALVASKGLRVESA
ncbi:virulence factor [Porticoccaceae bacterium]|nr:virulence factor [Porticoccaceae bacterium]MDB9948665.1 virulence factor [Porticoccaceae bacterium]MDB9970181.1 virulence factor [Porticoccaceae bacterium]MDC1453589.1 virulence factor [Porticoccaceae bacterium]MDC1513718.1 virulence factor [Porticoccaceae bacterium]